ncbi:MAG: STAS domain-containing protein [Phycisphaerae bacterium]|nr:STAS domain-containing protein [Phycisphaerae bacterium]
MPLEHWSDRVDVIRMGDEASFSEDLAEAERQASDGKHDLILDFAGVKYVNSSTVGKLLKARKQMADKGRKLVLTSLGTNVWGALLVMGLDQIFHCSEDVSTALASLQMSQ